MGIFYFLKFRIITGGEDKKIFIRKIYDFELLTAIDLSFIRGYNLNGLFFKQSEEDYFMNICFTKNYNLLVSYYNQNEIKILNCYDLAETSSEFYLNKLVEECEKLNNKIERKGYCYESDSLVWNDYDFRNHEFILLFKNKIVRGNFKDEEDIKNLEFY